MPYYIQDPQRDHNVDNHPCLCVMLEGVSRLQAAFWGCGFGGSGFGKPKVNDDKGVPKTLATGGRKCPADIDDVLKAWEYEQGNKGSPFIRRGCGIYYMLSIQGMYRDICAYYSRFLEQRA